jgi:integrase
MFTLGFRTGLRRESLALLQLGEIVGRRLTVIIKGGRRHTLDVDDEVLAALAPWRTWLARRGITSGLAFRSLRASAHGDWIVGKGLHPTSINRIMSARCNVAGVTFSPHLMRHCAISWLEAAGVPRARIAALTGHRDLRTISTYYVTDVDSSTDPVGGYLPPLVGH